MFFVFKKELTIFLEQYKNSGFSFRLTSIFVATCWLKSGEFSERYVINPDQNISPYIGAILRNIIEDELYFSNIGIAFVK